MRKLIMFVAVTTIVIGSCGGEAFAKSKKKKKTLLDVAAESVEARLTPAPKDQELCFAPDEPCAVKLAKLIASARKSVDMAIYDINEDRIVHELLVASKRVPVRVIVDRRQAQGSHSAVPLLIKAGLDVRFGHQRGIMHNKFTVVDGAMVETGSFNYTTHASEANNENQIYLTAPPIIERYRNRFAAMWSVADPVTGLRGVASKSSE